MDKLGQHPRRPGVDGTRPAVPTIIEIDEKEGVIGGNGDADAIEAPLPIGGERSVAGRPGAGIVGDSLAPTVGAQRRFAPQPVAVDPGSDDELWPRAQFSGDPCRDDRERGRGDRSPRRGTHRLA
jgi:hypothetical protein